MSNLATIQTVKNVRVHPNADVLDLVDVLGWQVVTKRGEFSDGDLCIYVCIDSVLPERPEFEFLRNKNFRIKPIRLRKEYSNGICFPLSLLNTHQYLNKEWVEGEDVTDILGVKHYEKPIPAQLAGQMIGHLPGFLRMTDEDNLRSNPDALPEMLGRGYYITLKDDGSSGTYFLKDGVFGVCSRRIHLKENPDNGFWKMAFKYNIENALRTHILPVKDIAIQGEVVGPGIQGNPLGLAELELHVFNLFYIVERTYATYCELLMFCERAGLKVVKMVEEGDNFQYTLPELIAKTNAYTYDNGKPAEGIVIRPQNPFLSTVLKKIWSAKVISEVYKDVE